MKWPKYYVHDPATTVLQLLYGLFHYCIIIDTPVTLLVIMICTKTITSNHLSSDQDGHLKSYKMKYLTRTTSLQNLSQCPKNIKSRLIKRIHIYQKYSYTRDRSTVTLLGVASTHLFTSYSATRYKQYYTSLPLPQAYKGTRFDSDSHQIGVDNHSSYPISNKHEYFISLITPRNATMLRINVKSKVSGTGTVR